MPKGPPVNPNIDATADRVKHGYARVTQLLAVVQRRLAELAGTGQLDADESMRLQHNLFDIWEELYVGTLCAVRDEDTDDCTWGKADNTYSDGRPVVIQIRIEPEEESDFKWAHNRFMLGDGAVDDHPRGTICCISPINPADEIVADPPHQRPSTDFDALRRRLLEAGIDWGDDQDTEQADGDDEIG